MKPNGADSWAGGAFNPEDGKRYSAERRSRATVPRPPAACSAGSSASRSAGRARDNRGRSPDVNLTPILSPFFASLFLDPSAAACYRLRASQPSVGRGGLFAIARPRRGLEFSMARAAAGKIKGPKTSASRPFERVALLLQGGGALGAYQAGVYQALAEANVSPTGSPGSRSAPSTPRLSPAIRRRSASTRLREFWEAVSTSPLGVFGIPYVRSLELKDDGARRLINQVRAFGIAMLGAPAFFAPRFPPLFLWPPRQPKRSATTTSRRSGDAGAAGRFRPDQHGRRSGSASARSTCAAATSSTSTTRRIRSTPAHIIASGSLPPGFPATDDRRRLLLGWGAHLQHAAAMGVRQHGRVPTRSPSRSIYGARPASCRAT